MNYDEERFLKAAAAPHSAPQAVHQRSYMLWVDIHEQRDGWTLKNNVIGCQADICVERILRVQSRLENRPRPRLKTLSTTILDSMEGGKTTGRTDELRYLPAPGCLFWLLQFPGSSLPSLCCSESEDSFDIELNSENSVQLRLCFLFFQPLAFLIEIRLTAHRHLTVCKCKPCQQRKPHLL